MPLVAITREMGSLGKDVASGLSEALGVPLVYHEVIDHLADRMRVRKSHVIRLLDGKANLLERKSAVIRGWGATHLLREVPHVVCVRVCASFEVRRRRMMERISSFDADQIGDEIRQNDEAHGAIMKRNFSVDWTAAENYDLVLNTDRASVKQCIDTVLALVRSAEFAETDASRQKLKDLALVWRVRARLRSSQKTRGLRVAVTASAGCVTLAGLLDRLEQREAVNEIAGTADGVHGIDDQLRTADALRPRHA